MTDIEIIFKKCKNAYYKGWADNDIEDCKERIVTLTLADLRLLNHSRWMSNKSPLYPTLFACLYKDELAGVIEKLNNMSNEDLLAEMKSTRSTFKKDKIPRILCERYDSMNEEERKKVFSLLVKKGLKQKEDN